MRYAYFRGYPRRYLRQCATSVLLSIVFIGSILSLAMAGLWVNVRLFLEERHWSQALFAVVAGFFTYYFGKGLLGVIGDSFHARIVIYFERRVGLAEVFTGGPALARNCRRLDALSLAAGVQPLSRFGFKDNYHTFFPRLDWRPAAEGLATIDALLKIIPTITDFPDSSAVLDEAASLKNALQKAEPLSIRFRLLLRQGYDKFVSPIEFDQRKGSFS